ncbi:MAG: hypothetical protein FRC53_08640 [Pseudoramibacter sp. EUB1.1]|uniref:Uncharacterized protein n=1 Tax=Candidatus Pseudoramibacter fermentans TaxID=2594427 RepID=A0A6L5GT55_9FIRM|nr:hypothetical protein [Candidatus Pseudoramibacter fermentans]
MQAILTLLVLFGGVKIMKKRLFPIVIVLLAFICIMTGCQKAAKPNTLKDLKSGDFVFNKDFPDKKLLANMQKAIKQIGMDTDEVDGFYVGPDWANGYRYYFQYGDEGTRYDIYVNQDHSVASIKSNKTKINIYEKGYEPFNYQEVENNPDYYANVIRKQTGNSTEETSSDNTNNTNTIILTDGETGKYGKLSSSGAVHFTVPAGHYLAESMSGNVKISQVNVNNEEDYSFIAEFNSKGEKAEIDVKDGYYLELTVNGKVKLTAK